jgi:beta-lactamase regulating signal transducer with metallopeptidase domain
MNHLLQPIDPAALCAIAAALFLQSSLVLVFGLTASFLIRTKAAAIRSALLRATLAAVVLAPFASLALHAVGVHAWAIPLEQARDSSSPVATPGDTSFALSAPPAAPPTTSTPKISPTVNILAAKSVPTPAAPPAPSAPRLLTVERFQVLIASVWLGIAALLLIRLLAANVVLWLTRRHARPASESIQSDCDQLAKPLGLKTPHVLINSEFPTPCLTGLLRPAIVLPTDEDPGDEVLIHELAHILRHDCLWQLLTRIATAVLWFQPLLWMLSRQIERAAEEACDDFVLAHGCDRAAYARRLLELSQQAERFGYAATALGVASFKSAAGNRIARLLEQTRPIKTRIGRLALCGILIASVIPAMIAGLLTPVAAAPPQEQTATLYRGQVVSPAGRPVAGAELYLFGLVPSGMKYELLDSGKTDSEGRFGLRSDQKLREYSSAQLTVRAAGFGLTGKPLTADDPNQVVLEPATNVRLVFLDEDSQPVPRLPVSITGLGTGFPFHSMFIESPLRERLTRETDALGAVTFNDLPQGYQFRPWITDDRFAQLVYRDHLVLDPANVSRQHTIILRPGGVVTGRVTFADGKPPAGIEVYCVPTNRRDESAQGANAVTDRNGAYRLTQLATASYRVATLLTENLNHQWAPAWREPVEVTGGKTTGGIDLTLTPGAVVTGKVIKDDTGQPVPNAQIGLISPYDRKGNGGWYAQPGRADAEGKFLLHVPPGEWSIQFQSLMPDGYRRYGIPNTKLPDWGAGNHVTVADGQTASAELRIFRIPGLPVSGIVLDRAGKPVSGATVVSKSYEDENYEGGQTITDAAGHFRLESVSPHAVISAAKGSLATDGTTQVHGGETGVTLRLVTDPFVTVTGVVTDGSGKPIEGIGVSLMQRSGRASWHGGNPVPTDASGRFTFRGLSINESYTIQARGGNFFGSQVDLHVVPDKTNEVNISLKKPGGD